MKASNAFLFGLALFATSLCGQEPAATGQDPPAADKDRIRPFQSNPRYWQYKGEPVLLLGGTKDDNLFQIPDLQEHLNLLADVGGNYIRNTMSDRDPGNHRAFKRLADGKYDLDRWNEAYWNAFENLLRWTHEREIIVQIEVWDRFDYTDVRVADRWKESPYNPANNVNYTYRETGLGTRYPDHPGADKQPFFHTIPGMKEYRPEYDVLRKYQERFVAKMLSHSLPYGNVLYCMNNETSTSPRWGRHWMAFIRAAAATRGVEVFVTDMFDNAWNPEASSELQQALDDPATYTFVDISQINSRNFGQDHWDRLQWVMGRVNKKPRPVNHTKIYGSGNTSWGSGSPADGVERLWRNILGGSASARFHRDGSGNGLAPIAQASIKAARKLETKVKTWNVRPRQDLLSERAENEAYLAARPGEAYVLYFPNGGSVDLDLRGPAYQAQWISVDSGQWGDRWTWRGGRVVTIKAPKQGGWIVTVTKIAPEEPNQADLTRMAQRAIAAANETAAELHEKPTVQHVSIDRAVYFVPRAKQPEDLADLIEGQSEARPADAVKRTWTDEYWLAQQYSYRLQLDQVGPIRIEEGRKLPTAEVRLKLTVRRRTSVVAKEKPIPQPPKGKRFWYDSAIREIGSYPGSGLRFAGRDLGEISGPFRATTEIKGPGAEEAVKQMLNEPEEKMEETFVLRASVMKCEDGYYIWLIEEALPAKVPKSMKPVTIFWRSDFPRGAQVVAP